MLGVFFMSFYKLTTRMLKSNYARLTAPAKITLAMTYACNFKCKTCNIGKNFAKDPISVRKEELSAKEIGKIFKNTDPSWIQLTGGEPFFRTDIYDIMKEIKENCNNIYAVHTTTNGFATENIVANVKKILDLKIPRLAISISIDGMENKHNDIRGVPNAFEHAMETFKQLKALENKNFNVFVSYTSSPSNMGMLEETMNGLKCKYGIDPKHFHMNLFHVSEHYFTNASPENKEEYNQKVINELKKMRGMKRGNDFEVAFLESKYLKFAEDFVKTGNSPMPCKALNSSCFIDPYGNIYPCLIWGNKIANLRDFDYDLKKIWQLQTAKNAHINAKNLNCPNCWTPCEAYQTLLGNLGKTLIK